MRSITFGRAIEVPIPSILRSQLVAYATRPGFGVSPARRVAHMTHGFRRIIVPTSIVPYPYRTDPDLGESSMRSADA